MPSPHHPYEAGPAPSAASTSGNWRQRSPRGWTRQSISQTLGYLYHFLSRGFCPLLPQCTTTDLPTSNGIGRYKPFRVWLLGQERHPLVCWRSVRCLWHIAGSYGHWKLPLYHDQRCGRREYPQRGVAGGEGAGGSLGGGRRGAQTLVGIPVVFQQWRWPWLHRPSTGRAVDKHANDDVVHLEGFRKAKKVLRTKRCMRVRQVRCVRAIVCVWRLPGLGMSGARCRVEAPQ